MTTPAGWYSDPEGSGQTRWWDGQQWTSAVQPPLAPPAGIPPGGPQRKKWPWIVGGVVGVLILFGVIGALGSPDDASEVAAPTTTIAPTTIAPATIAPTTTTSIAPPPPPAPVVPSETQPAFTAEAETVESAAPQTGMTGGQRNAVRSAESYLQYTSFSRQGLIDQLKYEDYSTEDATFAVDYVAPDWNEQAAESAESYLDYTSFSHQGLVDQLMYEGFTYEQAEYGVTRTGI